VPERIEVRGRLPVDPASALPRGDDLRGEGALDDGGNHLAQPRDCAGYGVEAIAALRAAHG
jgi:hypothetical protein